MDWRMRQASAEMRSRSTRARRVEAADRRRAGPRGRRAENIAAASSRGRRPARAGGRAGGRRSSRISDLHRAAGSRAALRSVRRLKTHRASRAIDSARCTYRPSQNRSSATRLGRSLPPRLSSTGCDAGASRRHLVDRAVAETQVSLLPPPFCSETTSESAEPVTRVSPPGITV